MIQIIRLFTVALVATLSITFAPKTLAELIGSESFSYPDGPIAGQAGGGGFDWNNQTGTHTGTKSDWDTLTGSPMVRDGKLVTGGAALSTAKREYNGPEEGQSFTNDEGLGSFRNLGVLYYRAEMTRGAGATWSGISSYDFTNERILVGVPGGNDEFAIKVSASNEGGDGQTNSGVFANDGETYELVVKFDFSADLISLFVNPNLLAPEAANTPVATREYSNTHWSTALRLGSNAGAEVLWDDLAVANSWDDLGVFAPTSVVTNGNNAGPGSLRDAIENSPSGTRITFDPTVFNNRENFIQLQTNLSIPGGKSLAIDASNIAGGITILGFTNSPPIFGGCLVVARGANASAKSITFRDGRAEYGGGVATLGSFSATNCVFDSNQATDRGGGFYNIDGDGVFRNCTFTGNSSDFGAAIHSESITPISTVLCHCTITNNSSPGGHAVSSGFGDGSVTTILSSIISGNTVDADVRGDGAANFVSEGGNLIGTGAAAILGVFTETGDDTGVTDPMLAPLTWNGGTTQTQLPLPGSPAIDSGATQAGSPATDARGLPRTLDGTTDVGAAEASWSYNTAASAPAGFGPAFDITVPGDAVSALPFNNTPLTEGGANAIDDDTDTKYLNFSIDNCGFDVTPKLRSTRLIGLTVTSANDVPGRDPATFLVIGQAAGQADTVIAAGQLAPTSTRGEKLTYHFASPSQPFDKYSVVFPSIVGPPDPGNEFGNNSMQVAEVELLGAPADRSLRITRWERTGTRPDDGAGIFQADFIAEPGESYTGVFATDLDFTPSAELVTFEATKFLHTLEFILTPERGFVRVRKN